MRTSGWLARAALFGLAGLVAGCAGIEVPKLEQALPSHWRHPPPAVPAAPVDLRGWWHAYDDPQLDALVDAALRDNLRVAESTERLQAARALYRAEKVAYLPRLRAKTEDAIDPDASASFFVAGFDSSWELDLFGRGTATHRQARGAVDAGVADLQQVRVSLVAEVVRDWLSLRAAQQRIAILSHIRDLRMQQLAQTRIRAKWRLAPATAEASAEADLAQAEAALLEPQGEADAAAQQLAVLLGRSEPDPAWLTPGRLPTLGALQIAQAPADLLRSRPDIARAEAEVLRAAGDAGVARADMFPRIGLGGSVVWSTNITTHRRTSDNAIASMGPMIDIPLFDWGARQAELHAAKHDLKASVYAYRQTVLQGVAETETALGELDRQREREAASARALAALERAGKSVDVQVRLHLAGPTDQLDSRLARAQAALACNQATEAHDLAFVGLYKALGGAPLPERERAQAEAP
jgi:NodT family efflux transporter outer membrane factor (OMF) lipoprotein